MNSKVIRKILVLMSASMLVFLTGCGKYAGIIGMIASAPEKEISIEYGNDYNNAYDYDGYDYDGYDYDGGDITIPDQFTGIVGSEGGKTEYSDAPTNVVELSLDIYSDIPTLSYHFYVVDDVVYFVESYNYEEEYEAEFGLELQDRLNEWVDDYGIRQWDGFDMTQYDVMDGSGFWLYIILESGETIYAYGSNAYPEGWGEAYDYLYDIIEAVMQ